MNHVISFSTGLSSAVTAERVINRFGAQNCAVVFMDVLIEHPDNYRFKDDCFDRWRAMGAQCVTLTEGRDPYDVAMDEGMIFNQRRHPCTRILKIEPFMRWLKNCRDPAVYIGIDFTEMHRCAAITRNYNAAGYSVDFPLLWKPYETRPHAEVMRAVGIEPPKMYELGYSHANCGGRCVVQGHGDWYRTFINDYDTFAVARDWELNMHKTHPKTADYAMLRDFRGGSMTPITLAEMELRWRKEKRDPNQLDLFSACVRCGVGDFVE